MTISRMQSSMNLVMSASKITVVTCVALVTLYATYAVAEELSTSSTTETLSPAQTRQALQKVIDSAAPGSQADLAHSEPLTIDGPLRITKPLRVRGLNLQLPPRLAKTPLLIVESSDVRITESRFAGNGDTVGQGERRSLVEVTAGRFALTDCVFENGSKNGVTVGPPASGGDVSHVVIRDVVGRRVIRDVVSIAGAGEKGFVRNVLVENVQAYDSELRGAVEVSDGASDVTVRGVFAERCVYAVDVQDHDSPGELLFNVRIEDVRARVCRHAVRTALDPNGHRRLFIRGVIAEWCDVPLRIDNIDDVTISDVLIEGRRLDPTETEDIETVFRIKNCNNVAIRDVSIANAGKLKDAIDIVDSTEVRVSSLRVDNVQSSQAQDGQSEITQRHSASAGSGDHLR